MTCNHLHIKYLCAIVALLAVLLPGCKASEPAAASNQRTTPAERARWLAYEDPESARAWTVFEEAAPVLSSGTQARLRNAFDRLPPSGYEPTAVPRAAPHGVRYDDIALGVGAACRETGMAIVRTEETETGRRFELKTLDNRRAVLEITRYDDERVYGAQLRIGRAADYSEREAEFVEVLREMMEAFGKKRKLGD